MSVKLNFSLTIKWLVFSANIDLTSSDENRIGIESTRLAPLPSELAIDACNNRSYAVV